MFSRLEELKKTETFKLYEKCYNEMLTRCIFENTEKNYAFFKGQQWRGIKKGSKNLPVLNIIKPTVNHKCSAITESDYSIDYRPVHYLNDTIENRKYLDKVCRNLSTFVNKRFSEDKMNQKIRKMVKDAGINGEGILHCYIDPTQENYIKTEVLTKNNIMYADEDNDNIQEQSYILIKNRMSVINAQEYAKSLDCENWREITTDSKTETQVGENKDLETEDKCLVIRKYYKKEGKIYATISTQTVTLLEDAYICDNYYPIIHFIWEDDIDSARGFGIVEGMIPNQIEINKNLYRRGVSIKETAFPKLAVNTKAIADADALTKDGAVIEFEDGTFEDVRKNVGYILPSQMSIDSKYYQEDLLSKTRELEGASEAAVGSVDPTKASARAIMAVQEMSKQPLSEQAIKLREVLIEYGKILFELYKVNSEDVLNIVEKITLKDYLNDTEQDTTNYTEKELMEEIEVPFQINKDVLEKLKLNVKVEITTRTPYSILARENLLEKLLEKQLITLEEFISALPDDSGYAKKDLTYILELRKANRESISKMEKEAQEKMLTAKLHFEKENEINNIAQQVENVNNKIIGGTENEMSTMQN